MYALVEMGMQFFSKKNSKLFNDIKTLAVLMSLKFFAQLSFKKARTPFSRKRVLSRQLDEDHIGADAFDLLPFNSNETRLRKEFAALRDK